MHKFREEGGTIGADCYILWSTYTFGLDVLGFITFLLVDKSSCLNVYAIRVEIKLEGTIIFNIGSYIEGYHKHRVSSSTSFWF